MGDPIAPVVLEKRTTYQHGSCRYPATAMLQDAVSQTRTADAVRNASPMRCRAITIKGKPCGNAPQKGEQFCGPHLTQLATHTTRSSGPSAP